MFEFGRYWRRMRPKLWVLLVISVWLLHAAPAAYAEDALDRKVKTKVAPAYPELARRSNMSLSGTVRVRVVVAEDGSIKDSKVLGGHPLLVNSALNALKKWKFEPANEETTGVVEFNFQPQ